MPEPNVDGAPLNHGLSEVSPNNPVSLSHASGHAILVNDAALELAGIDANTPDPAGGTIVRDDRGNPTGLLREAAEGLINARVDEWRERRSPEERAAEARRMMEMAGQDVLSKGITSFQDAGSSFDQIDQFRAWNEEGALPVRLYVMVSYEETNETLAERLANYRIVPDGNDFLAVRSIKRLFDGALGSHGAWLLEPYSDMPDSTGLVLDEPDESRRDRSDRHPPRVSGQHPRHRRPVQPGDAGHLRAGLRGPPGESANCVGGSNTPSTSIPTTCHASPGSG